MATPRGVKCSNEELAAQLKEAVAAEPGAEWADEGCLRYLAARDFNLEKATKMLVETLRWRESLA